MNKTDILKDFAKDHGLKVVDLPMGDPVTMKDLLGEITVDAETNSQSTHSQEVRMNKDSFWQIVNDAIQSGPGKTCEDSQKRSKAIVKALIGGTIERLQTFELIWEAYRSKLGKDSVLNHLARSIEDEFGDDSAMDAVSWMMLQGREFVEAVIVDHSTKNFRKLLNGNTEVQAEVYPLMEAWENFVPDASGYRRAVRAAFYDIDADCVKTYEDLYREKYGEYHMIVGKLLAKYEVYDREHHWNKKLNLGKMFAEVLNEELPKIKSA
jgi:hypothetical protein